VGIHAQGATIAAHRRLEAVPGTADYRSVVVTDAQPPPCLAAPAVWTQGDTRVAPRSLTETLTDATGTTSRERQAMLYAAPTNAAAPAPTTEYILVAAADQGGQAWVEVHASIDVNVGMLQLS